MAAGLPSTGLSGKEVLIPSKGTGYALSLRHSPPSQCTSVLCYHHILSLGHCPTGGAMGQLKHEVHQHFPSKTLALCVCQTQMPQGYICSFLILSSVLTALNDGYLPAVPSCLAAAQQGLASFPLKGLSFTFSHKSAWMVCVCGMS